jgi:hypothetical protein
MGSIRCKQIDNRVVTYYKKIVHRFFTELDLKVPLEQQIQEWTTTEAGRFIVENTVSPITIHKQTQFDLYELHVAIEAELEEKRLSEFYLKFGKV